MAEKTDKSSKPPVIVCFSGLDPTGGAGIQADIEAIKANDGHCASLITSLTVQNTHNVKRLEPVNTQLLAEQTDVLLSDIQPNGFKLGVLGSSENAALVADTIKQFPHCPVVLDPVLAAGGGTALATIQLIEVIKHQLLPLTTICTPNTIELQQLTSKQSINQAAQLLLEQGTKAVLATGGHLLDSANTIQHQLFTSNQPAQTLFSPRLPGEFHGSGCTLASALATQLALQKPINSACQQALDFTYQSLLNAVQIGSGQLIPTRRSY
ncbi:hydroxymethylpyrimidine/phosphomethylpyrimidine kinase [Endozoicomonas sp. SM1973]|uniref:hydroxymethylpyrimidine kinase n=1 Tax=Spartinivicinus marinus TaxID=2994442 RepID=A0A853I844_9GAMM|nr:hydroxymethylpyrimidine/phosphomethylpyrimidine kinase [Spartinivicinus marinus]MCX4025992.1 hydroxymethylpyrimidine/phosphomethylpyrimidine kinase [Spartinivicinus marinus]NYZ67892.1 hydroxymethylpyrimidine/phosphomethylpyrimidine kinase [Spartinivicinus marinus]